MEYDVWHNNFDQISYRDYGGQLVATDGWEFTFEGVASPGRVCH